MACFREGTNCSVYRRFDSYQLDIPNDEVGLGLMRSLIPYYITPDTLTTNSTIVNIDRALYNNDIDGMMDL